MVVELISVGTELLMGNIVNTNAAYLSRKCADLGLSLYTQVTVGDNPDRLKQAVLQALEHSDVIILTGGLGPTKDDLTKEIIAEAFGRKLCRNKQWEKKIRDYFELRRITPIAENNWKQADMIEGAQVLDNKNGTAPGEIVSGEGKTAILLPGPPNEMIPMFEESVYPYLKKRTNRVLVSSMIKVCGVGESSAEERILDLIEKQTNPTIAPYAKTGEVHFRVTAGAATAEEGDALLAPVVKELCRRFGDSVYTTEESVTLERFLVEYLTKKQLTLATAESITGGAIASRIISVPGASAVFKQGYITYTNEAKESLLGVERETLEMYSAVSRETAKEMAYGAWKSAGTDAALSITGNAGPKPSEGKPVGLVYIGCCIHGKTWTEEYTFLGNREKIRENAAASALIYLRQCLLK